MINMKSNGTNKQLYCERAGRIRCDANCNICPFRHERISVKE